MIPYHMVLTHADKRLETVDGEHEDLDDACRKAFAIAKAVASPGWRDGSPTPLWVSVYHGGAVELSIQVGKPDEGDIAKQEPWTASG